MEQRKLFEGELIEKQMKNALNKMENNKTPGNDGLTKEFLEKPWLQIKSPLLLFFKKCILTGELSTSQKQAVVKLLQKKKEIKC